MSPSIYKLVYCSRNEIQGSLPEVSAEINRILAASRKHNPAANVTGALLFNRGLFAQVLEGPVEKVEVIFERIQQDIRHGEVTVLQTGFSESRDFPEWSMAFASTEAEVCTNIAIPIFDAAFFNSSKAGEDVLEMLRQLVVQTDCMLAG